MVKYPNKKQSYPKQKVSYSNRGMNFEAMINETNEYYLHNNIAMIHKKPIPIQIVRVDYPNRASAVIKEAYYKVPSTTDYNGIYKGFHLDFEAKETKNKTSFPFNNIHSHQIEHLIDVGKHGGIAFLLIYFKTLDEIYLLEANHLQKYYERSKKGRKSMTYQEIKTNGYLITEGYAPRIEYLKAVDVIIAKKKAPNQSK